MIDSSIHGANLADLVFGDEASGRLDPADDFWEATKLHADAIGWQTPGVQLLAQEPELREIVRRGYRDFGSCPVIPLPVPASRTSSFEFASERRESADVMTPVSVPLEQLAWILDVSAGMSSRHGKSEPDLRRVPSAGGLHPLDLWVLPHTVEGLGRGTMYYVDNRLRALREVRRYDGDALRAASLADGLIDQAAFTVVVTATLWRSRFKYGVRGLRFALLEAGHVAQMLLLAAATERLGSRVIGGFCDDALSSALSLHGVDEVPMYLVPFGGLERDG